LRSKVWTNDPKVRQRGSGNEEADAAVLDALRRIGKVDQAPPPSLDFPARVLIQGRRPGA